MREIFFLLLLFLSTVVFANPGIQQEDTVSNSDKLISKGKVGPVYLNMRLSDLMNNFDRDQIVMQEEETGDGMIQFYEIRNPEGTTDFVIESSCQPECQVSKIEIYSPNYFTINLLRVGSSISDIRRVHKKIDFSEDNDWIYASTGEDGLHFVFSKKDIPQEWFGQKKKLEQMPGNIPSKAIFLM